MKKIQPNDISSSLNRLEYDIKMLNSFSSAGGWFGSYPTSPIYRDSAISKLDKIIADAKALKNLISR
jgi:hypothetical protein